MKSTDSLVLVFVSGLTALVVIGAVGFSLEESATAPWCVVSLTDGTEVQIQTKDWLGADGVGGVLPDGTRVAYPAWRVLQVREATP